MNVEERYNLGVEIYSLKRFISFDVRSLIWDESSKGVFLFIAQPVFSMNTIKGIVFFVLFFFFFFFFFFFLFCHA